MFHVNAKQLHSCPVHCVDERLERATLFPFFDREGSVEQLMLIDLNLRTLRVFPYHTGLVRPHVFQKGLTLRRRLADLPLMQPEDAIRLGELWHFDPWWILGTPPFDKQATTPLLKTTNCVDWLPLSPPSVGFKRDLSRTAWLFEDGSDEGIGRRWSADFLPEHHPEVDRPWQRVSPSRWVLDPIWMKG